MKSVLVILLLLAVLVVIGIVMSKGTLTGATTANTVSCSSNADCDDKIADTEDLCRNPGTEYSLCVNKPRTE